MSTPIPIASDDTAPDPTTTVTSNPARLASHAPGPPVRLRDVIRGEWIKFRSVRSTGFTLITAGVATVALGMIFTATAGAGADRPAPGGAVERSGSARPRCDRPDRHDPRRPRSPRGGGRVLDRADPHDHRGRRSAAEGADGQGGRGQRGDGRCHERGRRGGRLAGPSGLPRRSAHRGRDGLRRARRRARDDRPRDGRRPHRPGAGLHPARDSIGDRRPGRRHLRRPAAAEPAARVLLRRRAEVPAVGGRLGHDVHGADPDLLSTGAAYAVFAVWVVGLLGAAAVLLRIRDA